MARYFRTIPAFLVLAAAPVFAQQDLQTIGQIEAEFDGETLSQTGRVRKLIMALTCH